MENHPETLYILFCEFVYEKRGFFNISCKIHSTVAEFLVSVMLNYDILEDVNNIVNSAGDRACITSIKQFLGMLCSYSVSLTLHTSNTGMA